MICGLAYRLLASGPMPATPATPATVSNPAPAIPAILAAFDKYDVVAMPAGHGMKDVDDFILTLVRDPHFSDKVNDIAVECGNSLYQPALDRYIAGMDEPFAEVRKVWRNTTQEMCGFSGFYGQLFPLLRALNQKLPPAKRLRVLAGDPPIDWDQVKTRDDAMKFLNRDPSIASVMAHEVLAKHRKALMLFGTFHLMHGTSDNRSSTTPPPAPPTAVTLYEKDYPGRTWVISDFGVYDTSRRGAATNPFARWPNPSLVPTKGTWPGALALKDIFTPPIRTHDCKVTLDFPPNLDKPMAALVDAFLYLGPQDLALNEPTPANIALDTEYMTELSRRRALIGPPGVPVASAKELGDELLQEATVREPPSHPDVKAIEQSCLEQSKRR
jgi:hypothetical protein